MPRGNLFIGQSRRTQSRNAKIASGEIPIPSKRKGRGGKRAKSPAVDAVVEAPEVTKKKAIFKELQALKDQIVAQEVEIENYEKAIVKLGCVSRVARRLRRDSGRSEAFRRGFGDN